MHGMIEWFARNGVAANLMMVFIVVSGRLLFSLLESLNRS